MDPQAQDSAQRSIKDHVYKSDEVATAASIVQPGTGKILAMGQSRPYGFGKNETQINLSVDESMGGGMGYQPGSTFKPIVAAAALEDGMPANKVYSSPYQMAYPSPVSACDGKRWMNDRGNPAKLENENESEVGPYDMKEATAKSVNTYYVQMISDIGICPVTTMAKKMGVVRADGDTMPQVPSIALGTQEMSPLTMANAYATFASRGMYCTPVAIESITGGSATRPSRCEVPKSTCSRAMSEKTADTINTLLKGVVEDGTGTQAGLGGRPSAGKTGTTDERYAAWFVGYTPNMAGAVWVGDPAHKRKMFGITIGGRYYGKVFGGEVPGPIWRDMMSGALEGKPVEQFNPVHIPDSRDKDRGDGDGGGGRRRRRPATAATAASSAAWSAATATAAAATEPDALVLHPGGLHPGPGQRRERQPAVGRGASRRASDEAPSPEARADEQDGPLHSPTRIGRGRRLARCSRVRPERSQPASSFLTAAATRPPSACPATFGFTIFMTAPMARGPSAPAAFASSTAWATISLQLVVGQLLRQVRRRAPRPPPSPARPARHAHPARRPRPPHAASSPPG